MIPVGVACSCLVVSCLFVYLFMLVGVVYLLMSAMLVYVRKVVTSVIWRAQTHTLTHTPLTQAYTNHLLTDSVSGPYFCMLMFSVYAG